MLDKITQKATIFCVASISSVLPQLNVTFEEVKKYTYKIVNHNNQFGPRNHHFVLGIKY